MTASFVRIVRRWKGPNVVVSLRCMAEVGRKRRGGLVSALTYQILLRVTSGHRVGSGYPGAYRKTKAVIAQQAWQQVTEVPSSLHGALANNRAQ